MAKSYLKDTLEETGLLPPATGVKFKIGKVTSPEAKEGAWNEGRLNYVIPLTVLEPKTMRNMRTTDRITVGTEDDPQALKKETWLERAGQRIKRLLVRTGVPIAKEDEEWMAGLEGCEVICGPVTQQTNERGTFNKLGLYYREEDSDCPTIGLTAGKPTGGGAAAAGKRGQATLDDEDDPPKTPKADVEADADPPAKAPKAPKKPPVDDDED